MMAAQHGIVYSGAGISTAAGIMDYASAAAGGDSLVAKIVGKDAMPCGGARSSHVAPTKAHMVLARCVKAGMVHWWCQQNHDGLPQKAGVPQEVMNEIHGSWFDPSNRVIAFSENLRRDLYDDMRYWERRADLCLTVGTSLSGMNSDGMVSIIGDYAIKKYRALTRKQRGLVEDYEGGSEAALQSLAALGGSVIVGFQCTPLDDKAALRLYASVDDVFVAVAEEIVRVAGPQSALGRAFSAAYAYDPNVWNAHVADTTRAFAYGRIIEPNVFELHNYNPVTGERLLTDLTGDTGDTASAAVVATRSSASSARARVQDAMVLDLRPGSKIRITIGLDKDARGVVLGQDGEGHYRISLRCLCRVRGQRERELMETTRRLGLWQIVSALEGKLPVLPLVNRQKKTA